MRTLEEIKNDKAQSYHQCTFKQAKTFVPVWQLISLMDECAKIYAEEALDAAAEELDDNFSALTYYKQAFAKIISLKDQLK